MCGNDIVVTLQGTSYAVTYFKRRGSPGLFAKDIVSLHKNDTRIPMTSAAFLASAWTPTTRRASLAGLFSLSFDRSLPAVGMRENDSRLLY